VSDRGRERLTCGHEDLIAELLLDRLVLSQQQAHERGDICSPTQGGTEQREDVIDDLLVAHLLLENQPSQEAAVQVSQRGVRVEVRLDKSVGSLTARGARGGEA
jgi:hypothetical protein